MIFEVTVAGKHYRARRGAGDGKPGIHVTGGGVNMRTTAT